MILRTVKVPIELCGHCARYNKENQQRLYLALKILCPEGKTKLARNDLVTLALALGYSNIKTVKALIKKLELDYWINYNAKTGYYLIRSFDKLDNIKNYHYSTAIEFSLKDLNNIKAFNGAALFTYLHRNYWGKKIKKARSERKKGRSFNSRKSSPNFKKKYAPIALHGVQAIYNISLTKIAEMKREAAKLEYISVKPHFENIGNGGKINKLSGADGATIIQGAVNMYIQYPDYILPNIPVKRRRKYVTYKRIIKE